MAGELRDGGNISAVANLMLAMAEGRINQYVRSGFKRSPMVEWETQWLLLAAPVFRQA
jgi:TetR/AcrR family transcriptional regulator